MTSWQMPGAPLSSSDYDALSARAISRATADAASLRRVDSLVGAELTGQTRSGSYAGILIPNIFPGEERPREYRLRRDSPDVEQRSDGSHAQRRKYVGPPGRGGLLYFAPGASEELLADVDCPVVVVEGEFKTLALSELALFGLNDAPRPAFLPVGLQGVYNWRGIVGKSAAADGTRVDVRGPIADLSRLQWAGRRVVIVFDLDVAYKLDVQDARRQLTIELEGRGADVAWFQWPKDVPAALKGVDDLIAARGMEPVLALLSKAKPVTFKKKSISASLPDDRGRFICDADGAPKSILANAIAAVRSGPEFEGLAFDEFYVRTVAAATPWNPDPHVWSDAEDVLLAEWLQHKGIFVAREIAGQAVEVVSRERGFHPVRQYFDGLKWDGTPRLDRWLRVLLGATSVADGGDVYVEAVGAKWLQSAVARIYSPGCKADCVLILEGPQGARKSTALRVLGGSWFSDEIADLGSKDAAMQLQGVLILELAELDAMGRSETSRIKAFMSRSTDHFRPPYGKRVIDLPRQCVFAASTNQTNWNRDETGARRFWPVLCGTIDIQGLERSRDRLWAESVARYRNGEAWWIENVELVTRAQSEQAARYEPDAWDSTVLDWAEGRLAAGSASVSVGDALEFALGKPKGLWTRADGMRVGRCFTAAGWIRYRERLRDGSHKLTWRYRRDPESNGVPI